MSGAGYGQILGQCLRSSGVVYLTWWCGPHSSSPYPFCADRDTFSGTRPHLQVTKAEFLVFMLQELELVESAELRNILRIFDTMDTDGNGELNMDDVQSLLKRRDGGSPAAPRAVNENALV